jgi:hypothetical protein
MPPAPRLVSACPAPATKLTDEEIGEILDVLRSPRFVDLSPAQVFHILLDEGTYLASVSSFYRLLRAQGEVANGAARPPIRPGSVPSCGLPSAGRVILGYHETEGSSPGRVLRPLRGDRHLLPLRGGLGGGPRRVE